MLDCFNIILRQNNAHAQDKEGDVQLSEEEQYPFIASGINMYSVDAAYIIISRFVGDTCERQQSAFLNFLSTFITNLFDLVGKY